MVGLRVLARWATQLSLGVTGRRSELQFLAGAIALGLGFWGWSIEKPADDWSGHANNAFRTLQLITLNFPTNFDGKITWQLQIARLMVPLVAVMASFNVFVGMVARPLRLVLLPRSRNHIVVCGDTKLTEEALRSLSLRGRQIVIVAPKVEILRRQALEGFGMTVVEADLRQPGTFKQLSLRHAAALFITGPDDLDNLNLAMMAMGSVVDRSDSEPPLALAVMIDREDLAVELDQALDGVARQHRLRYHRLCPDREGVRLELARFAPVFIKPDLGKPSHVMVVGLAGRFEQVLAELVVKTQDHPSERPVISLILAKGERERFDAWHASRADLDLVVRFEFFDAGSARLPAEAALEAWRAKFGAPDLVVLMADDTDAIATAFALRRPGNRAGAENAPMLVRQGREDHLLQALQAVRRADRDLSRMVAFGGLVRAESIERVLDRKGDETAIALHAHYVDAAKALGWRSPTALRAWDDLSENMRDANRAAAEHAPVLFAAVGLRWVPRASGTLPGSDIVSHDLTGAEIEKLAEIEHRHWMAARIDRGWRYASIRDDARLLHPALVPFEQLTEEDKEKDRNTIRVLVGILTEQGNVLTRVPASGAREA